MNQILYEELPDRKPTDIKKIVVFFCFAIILFGLAMGAIGVVQILNSSKPVSRTQPTLTVEKIDDYSIKISVIHDKPIDKIIYSWNMEESETIEGKSRKNPECLIDIPIGDNMLSIEVVDTIGVSAYYSGTYSNGEVAQGPKIKLSQTEVNKVKKIHIRAEDDKEIDYVTFRWNDDDEEILTEKDSSNTIIEADIDIPTDLPSGNNQLIVIAVDAENNTTTETQDIKIAKKPIIEQPHQYGGDLVIKITDEVGLDFIRYTLNGETFSWENVDDIDLKTFTKTLKLELGENTFIIEARNKDGIDAKKFYGRCIYTFE